MTNIYLVLAFCSLALAQAPTNVTNPPPEYWPDSSKVGRIFFSSPQNSGSSLTVGFVGKPFNISWYYDEKTLPRYPEISLVLRYAPHAYASDPNAYKVIDTLQAPGLFYKRNYSWTIPALVDGTPLLFVSG